MVERFGRPCVESSWEGIDEGDEVSGRGGAVVADHALEGRIFFHLGVGDDFGFRAVRTKATAKAERR